MVYSNGSQNHMSRVQHQAVEGNSQHLDMYRYALGCSNQWIHPKTALELLLNCHWNTTINGGCTCLQLFHMVITLHSRLILALKKFFLGSKVSENHRPMFVRLGLISCPWKMKLSNQSIHSLCINLLLFSFQIELF